MPGHAVSHDQSQKVKSTQSPMHPSLVQDMQEASEDACQQEEPQL